jgi:hypothetical protein
VKPEPHPEARIREALKSFDAWAVEVDGYKPGEVSGEALAALDVLVGRLERIQAVVNEQAEDGRVFFVPRTAPEAYLMQEIRRLHDAIEREALGVPPQPGGSGS